MIIAAQNNTIQSGVRALTVDGIYPNGDGYSATVQARSTFEAMIRVLADCRYSDDGGDLAVSRVCDVATGAVLDKDLIPAEIALLTEVEAIGQVLEQVAGSLLTASFADDSSSLTLRAYTEYFDLILSYAPHALSEVSGWAGDLSEEEMTLEFEDSKGKVHEFEPAAALLVLVEVALQHGDSVAAMQAKSLATSARSSLNKAAFDALA